MSETAATIRPFTRGNVLILSVLDRRLVEGEHVARLGQEMREAVKQSPQKGVVVDFEKVEFVSSSLLGEIVTLQSVVQENGGAMALSGLTADLRKLFKMTRLDKRLSIFDSRDDAVEAFE